MSLKITEKRPPRTLKQRRWVKLYLQYNNATKAAVEAYGCDEASAGQIGWENLQKLDFTELLEEAGVTDSKIATVVKDGMEANKVISANVYPDGKTGKPVNDFIEVEDHPTRLKAAEIASKLKNKFPAEKPGITIGGIVVINDFKRELGLIEDQLSEDSFRGAERLDEEDTRAVPVPVPTEV